jgi:hypothetical protein
MPDERRWTLTFILGYGWKVSGPNLDSQTSIEVMPVGVVEPGRWWRVLDPNGELWCETSSEKEARAAMRPGDKLERQFVGETPTEWRAADDD